MRKRSLVLSLFLVLSVLFLGLGYATLTTSLQATGTIGSTPDSSNLNVRFVNDITNPAETVVSNNKVTIDVSNYESKSVSFGVAGFTAEGQSATIVLKIANNSQPHPEYAAILDKTFDIVMSYKDGDGYTEVTDVTTVDVEDAPYGSYFEGDHYKVTVQYVTEFTGLNGSLPAAINVDMNGGAPILEAENNEFVYLLIKVEVINPITDEMPEHKFTVTFDAENYVASQEHVE